MSQHNDTLEHRIAARVRAAMAYSGLGRDEVLERMGALMSDATLRRIMSATKPRGAGRHELVALADACGVPLAWLERGEWNDDDELERPATLEPFDANGSTAQRLAALEYYVAALLRVEQRRYAEALPVPRAESSPRPRARRTTRSNAALPAGRAADSR